MNKKVAIIGVVGAIFVYFVWRRRKAQKDLQDPAKQDVLEEATGPMWYETGMVQKVFKFLNEEMKKRGNGAVAIQAQTFTPTGSDIQAISMDAFRDANRIMADKLLETKAYLNNAEMKQAYKLWLLRGTRLDKARETRIEELGASPMPTYTDVVFNNPTPQPTSYIIKQGL